MGGEGKVGLGGREGRRCDGRRRRARDRVG